MPEIIETTPHTPRNVFTAICGYCGIALYPNEVAMEFGGTFIDYEERITGIGSFVLCGECRIRVKTALARDLDMAIKRREELGFEGDNRNENITYIP